MSSTDCTQRFNELVNRYNALIYKVCYMYAEDSEHLKDLRQEVMANLWQGLAKFRDESAVSTWIYRVAINTCVSYFRRYRKGVMMTDYNDTAMAVADDSEHQQLLRQMYEMISVLPKIDRAIVMLWLDGLSYDEIADVVGLSRANVASRLFRAKQRMMNDNV